MPIVSDTTFSKKKSNFLFTKFDFAGENLHDFFPLENIVTGTGFLSTKRASLYHLSTHRD